MTSRRVAARVALVFCALAATSASAQDCVVFLHGLARTSASMDKMAAAFARHGYSTANVDSPSRKHPVEELAPTAVESGIAACPEQSVVHFVTHSLGGILVRYYLENHDVSNLGRVVMLAPPNQGSEVVDNYRRIPGFKALNGPAGLQLGTDADSIPSALGPVDFELGVIAGNDTFNPILSQSLPNPDDGKVSVENTKVEGMTGFVVVPYSHTFIMRAPPVIEQALEFVRSGRFLDDTR